jgi:2'-5' RNA ligase
MRLFVCVDLDGRADEVAAVQDRLRDASGLRFTDPEQVHVTLTFLGEVDESRLPALTHELAGAVDDAGVDPFTAVFGGLGVFPSLDYITVVWVGVHEGGRELTSLHEAIEDRIVAMGFDPADHDFTPHATVARMEHAGGKDRVQSAVREDDATVGAVDVTEVRLTESTLTEDGPVYDTLERFSLAD